MRKKKALPSATLATTNPTLPEMVSHSGLGERLATNRVSHGPVFVLHIIYIKYSVRTSKRTHTASIRKRQAMYTKRNTETRSCNNYCGEKAISITHSEYVSVALGIQHAMRMRRVVIRGLCGSTIYFFTLSHEWYDFRKRKRVIRHKMCLPILSTTGVLMLNIVVHMVTIRL